jgi:hypothetical protein
LNIFWVGGGWGVGGGEICLGGAVACATLNEEKWFMHL